MTIEIKNPYSNLEVFGPYVTFIEQQLKAEPPSPDKPIFEKTYKVKTLQDWDERKAPEYEYGNRIIAPSDDFNHLITKGAETPMILQIFNKNIPEKISHCSVIQWTAPKDIIYVPPWMMFDFLLTTASSKQPELTLRYYEKPFLKGSFIQIQPYMLKSIESDEFKDVQKLFESSLKKYQCLTIGDTLRIQHNKNIHLFEVTDVLSAQSIAGVTPSNIVSLVETDVAVDFLPPKDAPIQEEKNDSGYDVNINPKSDIPQQIQVVLMLIIIKLMNIKHQRLKIYKNHSVELDKNWMIILWLKKKEVESFANIKGEKIVCDKGQKTTRIQFVLIGNTKEAVEVNLSTTIMQLYAHAKLLSVFLYTFYLDIKLCVYISASGYEMEFQLLCGFPPKPLKDPKATVGIVDEQEEKMEKKR